MREVVFEYATRNVRTNFGFVGESVSTEAFRYRFRRLDGGPGFDLGAADERWSWTVVAITSGASELGRLRGRNWFFDPLASMQILLPGRQGVRVEASRLALAASLRTLRAKIPEPFDRRLRIRKSVGGFRAEWEPCSHDGLDLVLTALVTFRFWLETQGSGG